MGINRIKNKKDAITGLGIVVFLIAVYSQTADLEDSVRLFPRAVMLIGLLMGIGIIIKSFITPNGNKKDDVRIGSKLMFIKIALLLFIFGMLMLVKIIGIYTCIFFIISAISLTVTCVEYGLIWKKILFMSLFNLIVTAAIFILFNMVLGVLTPDGLLI
jgi:hypothetical protein